MHETRREAKRTYIILWFLAMKFAAIKTRPLLLLTPNERHIKNMSSTERKIWRRETDRERDRQSHILERHGAVRSWLESDVHETSREASVCWEGASGTNKAVLLLLLLILAGWRWWTKAESEKKNKCEGDCRRGKQRRYDGARRDDEGGT